VTHWHDAGFGTDPEGDARRRAEQGVVELPDGTRVAGAPDEQAAIDAVARFDPAALPDLADAVRRTAHLVPPSPAEVEEVLGAEVVQALDPHAIEQRQHGAFVAFVCACGRWDAVVTGPSSARWAGADHRRHVADETASDA
jgi:hypothetical protein